MALKCSSPHVTSFLVLFSSGSFSYFSLLVIALCLCSWHIRVRPFSLSLSLSFSPSHPLSHSLDLACFLWPRAMFKIYLLAFLQSSCLAHPTPTYCFPSPFSRYSASVLYQETSCFFPLSSVCSAFVIFSHVCSS